MAIVALQNTEAVETHILFATVTMPRAVLLLTTLVIGFASGILMSLIWMRKHQKPRGSHESA